jgi:hypothetical protein
VGFGLSGNAPKWDSHKRDELPAAPVRPRSRCLINLSVDFVSPSCIMPDGIWPCARMHPVAACVRVRVCVRACVRVCVCVCVCV